VTLSPPVAASAAEHAHALVGKLVRFLETNTAPEGLFAPNLFSDLSLPQWRIQADSAEAIVQVRRDSHPDTGSVPRSRTDLTEDGFVFEFEERWTDARGEPWYCREMIRATIRDGVISEMSIYCTGDWDRQRQTEHANSVKLLRP
jgi:hypothetical protein